MREHTVRVRFDAAELQKLMALAAHHGLASSSMIRMLVTRGWQAMQKEEDVK